MRSSAKATWHGSLGEGHGHIDVGSGSIPQMNVSWAARTQAHGGKTSPEELIASAHAACYAMAFTHTATQAGHAPSAVEVDAVCSFEQVDGKFRITTMKLTLRAALPGADDAKLQDLARQAEQGCPVSNALRNNVSIEVEAAAMVTS